MRRKTLAKLKKELWELCKLIIRRNYPNICYTCGKTGLQGHDWQTGHSKPKSALPLRFAYDIRGLRPQCYKCNINYGGCADIFITKLEKEKNGMGFLNDSCTKTEHGWIIKNTGLMGGVEAYTFVLGKIEEYKKILF